MSDDVVRFRIKPDSLEAALADFRTASVEPSRVVKRDDGAFSVEFDDLTDTQAAAVAAAFRPEHSAIIGLIGGWPFESK